MTEATDRPPIDFRLDGRVVLITGGVRGVGAGLSEVFVEQKATVITCARRPVDGLPHEFHSCDIRDENAVVAMIDTIVSRHGRIDVVVNNAGGSPYVPTSDATPTFNEKIVALNLSGTYTVAYYANSVMQHQDQGGAIINISSVSGNRPSPGTAAYGAAKAGLTDLTGTLGIQWAPKVRVNALIVGMVQTEQSHLFYGDADSIAAISAHVPLGRLAVPRDVGMAAAFLASDAASYITGASLEVHGGGEPPPYLSTTTALS